MARPLRIEYAGAVYHVTSRGNAGNPIFDDDKDRIMLLNILGKVNDRYHWLCHAYCLMVNHYHFVLETPDGNLSKGMRQLNGIYTMRFNKRHQRAGHVFQGRYRAILIQKESHFLEVCRYVLLNPVRANMIKTPEGWRWSSYRGTVRKERPHPCLTVDWILGQFRTRKREAERKFKEFVYDGIGGEPIWKEVKNQSLLGGPDFVDQLVEYLRGHEEIKEIPKSQRYMNRPSMGEIFKEAKDVKKKRNVRIADAIVRWGYSQREIADYLRLHYSTVSRLLNEAGTDISKVKT
ncbi:MAG: addiction module toxin RelE [Deltaproteobacteria bacterium RBG_16_47_11]|nr:MAG: addiction module toxin RelE [Deltaproteobacteria bacterium RBG_16_47_11]